LYSAVCGERVISWADLQLYDSEFQTEGALTLSAFDDIRGTVSNNMSDGGGAA